MKTRSSRGPRRRFRFALAAVLGLLALAAFPGMAAPVNYSHPATYSGTAASGGTVEFDVSADGSAVTRFGIDEVPTVCGILRGGSTDSFPIANEAFSGWGGGMVDTPGSMGAYLRIDGSFPSAQEGQGTIGVSSYTFGSLFVCMAVVSWGARTPTPPTPPPDTTAPQTQISSGPSGKTASRKAKFRFTSNEAASTFQCKLDGKKWASCRSPKTYKKLAEGKHTFRVKARDAAGNVDLSPARRSWRVTSSG
jgi:hypothetical protein